MKECVLIRELKPEETEILTEFLYHAVFVPAGMDPPSRNIVKKPELQVYVSDFGRQRSDHALVAEAASRIVGAVWVRDMLDYGHIEDGVPSFAISVLPEHRGHGIGTALMQKMLEHLCRTGSTKASLAVQKMNPAVRFYKRLGFQTIGETNEEYLMAIRMDDMPDQSVERGENQMTEYSMIDNQLTPDDFIYLFAAAGWGDLSRDMVETALAGSWATFSVQAMGKTIAMARLLGDGAMAFFLKDLVVAPEHQGCGIGRNLMQHIEEYIRQQLHPGWDGYLQLVSAKDKEGFYQRLGYQTHPHEHSGPGMSKWVRNSEG